MSSIPRFGQGARHVILLHGFLGSGRNLRSLAQKWSDVDTGLSLWTPDLPGHGHADPLEPPPTLAGAARQLAATCEAASIPKPWWLVGHSLGGRVALQMLDPAPARSRVPRIAGVVLLDITAGPMHSDKGGVARVLKALLEVPGEFGSRKEAEESLLARGVTRELTFWLLMNLEAREGRYLWRFDRDALALLSADSAKTDLWPVVETAPVPIHCIRGERSLYVSDQDMDKYAHLGRRTWTLEDTGHFLHTERPEALLAILSRQDLLAATN